MSTKTLPFEIPLLTNISDDSPFETRAADVGEGVIDAYASVFDTIDSYGSYFARGAFKRTISQRVKAGKVKVLWNHDPNELIGHVLEAKEDEKGLWVRYKLALGVPRADEVRTLMQSGALTSMSFGFSVLRERMNKERNAREIQEVILMEVSPVTFPANEDASIERVRSSDLVPADSDDMTPEDSEARATDFETTLSDREFWQKGWNILEAHEQTIEDIAWSMSLGEELFMAIDDAWSAAHAAYLEYTREMIDRYADSGMRNGRNDLSDQMLALVAANTDGIMGVAAETPLSKDEIRTLLRGDPLLSVSARSRLAEVSPELARLNAEQRSDRVAVLFNELRSRDALSEADVERVRGLLPTKRAAVAPKADDDGWDDLLSKIKEGCNCE